MRTEVRRGVALLALVVMVVLNQMVAMQSQPEARTRDGHADARWLLRTELHRAFEPREMLTPSQWADRYRVIADGTGPHPGPWKTSMAPYFREPMDAWADPDVESLVWVFGSQMGKTEALMNCVFATMDQEPAWSLLGYPSASFAKDVLAERVVPNIEASPRILSKLRQSRADRKVDKLRFEGGTLNVTGSGSSTEAKGRPVRYRYLDEVDEMDPAFVAEVDQRGKAYGDDAKRLATSTPTFPGVGIDQDWQNCLQLEWSVPCPHCEQYIGLTFEQLTWGVEDRDEAGNEIVRRGSKCTPDEVEDTAHVVCPCCGAAIYEHHKNAMEQRGVYLAEGQSAKLVDGRPVVHGERPRSRKVGFRANSMHSLFLPWGKMARAFADNGFTLTPSYVTGYLAQPWQIAGDKVDVAELKSLTQRSTYRMRTVGQRGEPVRSALPEGVRLVTLGVDVQSDSVWFHYQGWAANASGSYLVDLGSTPCPEGTDLGRVIVPLLARTFATMDGRTLKPWAAVIDSGHRTADVYQLCQDLRTGPQRVYPVKGRWGATMPEAWKLQPIDRWPDGRVMAHGLKLLEVNTDIIKSFVLGALKASATASDAVQGVAVDGAKAEDLGVKHRFHLPSDTPDVYVQHMVSEHRVRKDAKRTAAQKRSFRHDDGFVWEMRPGYTRNEYLDTTGYQVALAMAQRFGAKGMLDLDAMSAAVLSPQSVARPLAGLEDRLKDINARRRRR